MIKTWKKFRFRSPSFVNRMGAVLLDSESAFRAMIHERASLLQSILVIFSIAFLTGGIQIIHLDRILQWLVVALQLPYSNLDTIAPGFVDLLQQIEISYPEPPLISWIVLGVAFIAALIYALFWFLWATVSFILARLFFNGTGSWSNDLSLFAYCSVVDVFVLIVGLIMLVAHPLFALGTSLLTPFILLTWKIVMAVQALKENHGLPTAHAFYIVFLIPLFPLFLIFIVGAFAFYTYTVPLLGLISEVI
ncbi:MAG: YIP1 family protein [Candidatus Heimdallarchaeota archaeon]